MVNRWGNRIHEDEAQFLGLYARKAADETENGGRILPELGQRGENHDEWDLMGFNGI